MEMKNQWKRRILRFIDRFLDNFFNFSSFRFVEEKKQEAMNNLDVFLKSPDSNKLIQYYESVYGANNRLKDKQVWMAYNIALTHCYYGEYDYALLAMSSIKWANQIPYYQTLELSIRALINYLNNESVEEGLKLAIEAKKRGLTDASVQGSDKLKEFYETYIVIGELLIGEITDGNIEFLEKRFLDSQIFPKILVAWCLGNVYTKNNMNEKARDMIDYCRYTVPYCKPLNNFNYFAGKSEA